MGYSVYVEFKDENSKNKMLAFMEHNYKELDVLVGFELVTATAARLSDDLSYSNNKHKNIVGFDYQSWVDPFERNYINALTRWIALNVDSERPYYIYDGCENEYFTCDNEHGYKEFKPYHQFPNKSDILCYNNLLKHELRNFSERWGNVGG